MPSPIGHGVTGVLLLIIRYRVEQWRQLLRHWRQICLFVFLAISPDIDLFDPQLGHFDLDNPLHHQWTHSFSFALLIGLVVVLVRRIASNQWDWRLGGWSVLVVSSHTVLDLFFSNKLPGMPVFLPFSNYPVMLPVHFYYFWDKEDIFTYANFFKFLAEIAIGLGLITFLLRYYSCKRTKSQGVSFI